MFNPEKVRAFVAMWRWLSAHPAHGREYYLKNVVKESPTWINDCPLATEEGKRCAGCRVLWNRGNGSLCTDSESPLLRWQEADMQEPDLRVYYASEVGALGMQMSRQSQAT